MSLNFQSFQVPAATASSPSVSTAVSTDVIRNPWGRANDDGGLNLHRNDLWYVDFSTAAKALHEIAEDVIALPAFYVTSLSMAGYTVRADTFRRDSIPFQMPSWDEPVEPLTVTFLMESKNPNVVLNFLSTWLAATRAGRGERYSEGFDPNATGLNTRRTFAQIELNENYTIDFVYTFTVWLLQGSIAPAQAVVQVEADTFNDYLAYARAQRQAQSYLQQTHLTTTQADYIQATQVASLTRRKIETKITWCQCERIIPFKVKAWLASYKVSDLAYRTGTDIVTVEAKFYPEYIEQVAQNS